MENHITIIFGIKYSKNILKLCGQFLNV